MNRAIALVVLAACSSKSGPTSSTGSAIASGSSDMSVSETSASGSSGDGAGSSGSSASGSSASGSSASGSGSSASPGPAASVVVTFEKPAAAMAARDAKLAFVIENRGTAPYTLDLDRYESAIFAVEVFDANGKQRYTIPPGMPPANYQPRTAVLTPSDQRRIEVTLNVFSPELAAGRYTARLRAGGPLTSNDVTFQIR